MIGYFYKIVVVYMVAASSVLASEDLLDIYSLAIQNDPQLKQAEYAQEIAVESRKQDFSYLLPKIEISGELSDNTQTRKYDLSQFNGEENYSRFGYSLSITQPVIHYTTYINYKQSTNRIKLEELNLIKYKQSLMISLAQRYFAVLAAQDNIRFLESEKQAAEMQLRQIERLLDAGLATITDVYEAKAQIDASIALAIEANNQLSNSLESLKEITNSEHNTLSLLSESIPLKMPDLIGVDSWEKLALENNLDIISLQQSNHILRQEINRQRAGHYPTLDLVAQYSKVTSGGGDFGQSNTDSRTIGLQLNIPIYQGGIVTSSTKQAVYRYEQNLEKLDESIRAVRYQIRKSYNGVITSIALIESLDQSVFSYNNALNAIKAGNIAGMRTTADVLLATKNLFRAQRDYERARYDYLINILILKQSAGDLTLNDIKQINEWLE